MHEVRLNAEEERLRLECELEATGYWPGARVLVDTIDGKVRAAVYLPEDGAEPDASAECSAPRSSAREALDEVLVSLRRQRGPRSSA
jgi:hypothetical protein